MWGNHGDDRKKYERCDDWSASIRELRIVAGFAVATNTCAASFALLARSNMRLYDSLVHERRTLHKSGASSCRNASERRTRRAKSGKGRKKGKEKMKSRNVQRAVTYRRRCTNKHEKKKRRIQEKKEKRMKKESKIRRKEAKPEEKRKSPKMGNNHKKRIKSKKKKNSPKSCERIVSNPSDAKLSESSCMLFAFCFTYPTSALTPLALSPCLTRLSPTRMT